MAAQGTFRTINVDDLALDLENPRHGKLTTPEEAIAHLVEKEKVIDLALEIVRKGGTNPMELMGVVAQKGAGKKGMYTSAEGNRRVCALMLLHDPEKIPTSVNERAKKVRVLEKATANAVLPRTVNCVEFASKKEAMPWIELMHIADQDGRARKRWTPDQQATAVGRGRNQDALQLLNLAEQLGLIDRRDREAKLTTVQRYLGNPVLRAALGIERQADQSLAVAIAPNSFSKIFEAFMADVRAGKLSSRSKSDDVRGYAAKLTGRVDCDRTPVTAAPLTNAAKKQRELPAPTPPVDDDFGPLPRPPKRVIIGRNPLVEKELFAINSQKLTALYLSCVQLPLREHTPLLTVGLWSILESLASLHAGADAKFVQYFSSNNLENKFGITDKNQKKAILSSLEHISEKGNATKHNRTAASFDGQQLANDFDVIAPLLIAVCSKIPR